MLALFFVPFSGYLALVSAKSSMEITFSLSEMVSLNFDHLSAQQTFWQAS